MACRPKITNYSMHQAITDQAENYNICGIFNKNLLRCIVLAITTSFLASCGLTSSLISSVHDDSVKTESDQENAENDNENEDNKKEKLKESESALASDKTTIEKADTVEKQHEKAELIENKPIKSELPEDEEKPTKTKKALLAETKKQKPTSEYQYTLPGVRPNGGIVIEMRSSMYDDTDIDANEEDSSPLYTLSSLGGFGRTLPNGLRTARPDVNVSCLKPKLVHILRTVERRFRKPVIVTSGYRSPNHNRRVNGAKYSYHMSCSAADIQVVGVNKWQVAQFIRSLPGRGGVGTYCHPSIHVDVGPKRDWNWACRGKK